MREKVAIQLCGRDFDIVKDGLDASQVEELVTELVSERDALLQRQEHLTSLTKLAERSVAEADALAQEIKQEAEDEAKKQTTVILAEAEREAQELAERKRGEILSAANKEAQVIKENAQKEVDHLISQRQEQIQRELGEIIHRLHSQLLSGLKDVTEQAAALQTEWQHKITEAFNSIPSTASEPPPQNTVEAEPNEDASQAAAELEPVEDTPTLETVEPVEDIHLSEDTPPPETAEPVKNIQPSEDTSPPETAEPVEPEENIQPSLEASPPETTGSKKSDQKKEPEMSALETGEADLTYRQDILAQIEQAWLNSESRLRADDQPTEKAPETGKAVDTAEKTEVPTLAAEAAPSKAYEGTLALDIMPPLNPSQLVEIQKYLRSWPGIGITELSPRKKGYSITVVLRNPMQLTDILKQLPEVADAREYTPEEDEVGDNDTLSKDDKKRIAITVRSNK